MCYSHKLDGYLEGINEEFTKNFNKVDESTSCTKVKGVEINMNEYVLITVKKLLRGMKWKKNDMELPQKDKRQFSGSQRNTKNRKEV